MVEWVPEVVVSVIKNEEFAKAVQSEPLVAEKEEESKAKESAIPEKAIVPSVEVVEVDRRRNQWSVR